MARKNSLRLPYYEYREGWFLVTVNTHRRRPTLGRLRAGELEPSRLGDHAAEAWAFTLSGRPLIVERAFQLMPNHFHGVVGLQGDAGTLGQFVNTLKGRATRNARAAGALATLESLWHRGYHARWLPDEGAVRRAVAYVENNPKRR
ncbi:MAG: transposase [Myxococcales bacterium]|nr:transposase [Myxococcales bacterium]